MKPWTKGPRNPKGGMTSQKPRKYVHYMKGVKHCRERKSMDNAKVDGLFNVSMVRECGKELARGSTRTVGLNPVLKSLHACQGQYIPSIVPENH